MPRTPPTGQTTNATPLVIPGALPQLEPDEVCRSTVHVFANDHGTGAVYWEIRATLRRTLAGVHQGIFTQLARQGTPAAATWTAVATLAANGQVEVTVTGEAGKTIDWAAMGEDPFCMSGPFVP